MNKKTVIILSLVVMAGGCLVWFLSRGHKDNVKDAKIVTVNTGSIENAISSTGNIHPQNRLQIKPSIGGRIEKLLVVEGQRVKAGDVLAIMSSTDRATLLDAARLQGADSLKEWEDVYKPTPLLSPIDAQVIVKSVNPGQIVTVADDVVVLSDRLIIQAQVDETDVGKVKLGQAAVVTLDAYPDIEVKGKVDHIYYESKIVNNVTIYDVDIVPEQVPDVFRSGMSANVRIVQEHKDNVLLIAKEAVKSKEGKHFVLLKIEGEAKPQRQEIKVGLSDDANMEVVSGLSADDKIVIPTFKKDSGSKAGNRAGARPSSPFMPTGGRGGR